METFTPEDPDFARRVRESFDRQRFMDYSNRHHAFSLQTPQKPWFSEPGPFS